MINCNLSIILVADSRKKNRTSIVVLTKKKNFREFPAPQGVVVVAVEGEEAVKAIIK